MKAIQIDQYGSSDKLKLIETALPELQKREVLVKIQDAGVNPIDWKIREGERPMRLPLTLGQDFAGEITKVGSGAKKFEVGDRVVGISEHGAYAEFTAIDQGNLVLLDNSISNEIAAALPTPGLTAYQLIVEAAHVQAGQTILIHGASGAVGSIAVQIAVSKGAKVIANASLSDADYLYQIGVSDVIDHKREAFEEKVSELDAVIDLVGGDTAARSVGVLKEGGILVSTVGAAKESAGVNPRIKAIDLVMRKDTAQLAHLVELVKMKVIQVRLATAYNLEDARIAQDLSQHGHVNGKIIIHVQ